MSCLSIVMNLVIFSVIFYCTKCVVLNAALFLPPASYCRCYMSPLDCFRFLILNISTLQTFYPQVCHSNITCASQFCYKLCSGVKKKKNRACVHVQNCGSPISGTCPYRPRSPYRSCRSDWDIPKNSCVQ